MKRLVLWSVLPLALLGAWFFAVGVEGPPPQSGADVQLVIEDADLAAWMPIDNTFVGKVGEFDPKMDIWNGLLIQLGSYQRIRSGRIADISGPVVIKDAGGRTLKTLQNGSFRWLNIIGNNTAHKLPPLDLKYLPILLKPLHGTFFPSAIITFWLGCEGYDLSCRPRRDCVNHFQCTFTLKDVVRIEADGTSLTMGKGASITASSTSAADPNDPDGGSHSNPPPRSP
jgi:hypothetical protein